MKKVIFNKVVISFIGLLLVLFVGGTFAKGWALPLPSLDFQGSVYIDMDTPYADPNPYNTVKVTSYTDKDGWDSDLLNPNDPILGQLIWGFNFLGFDYDWETDNLAIDPDATADFVIGTNPSTDPYLTATASNINVTKLGYRNYIISARLTDHSFYHTSDSVFMEQFADAVSGSDNSQLLTWNVVFELPDINDYDYKINVSGKLAPVPEPATILLFGTGLIGLAGAARRKIKKA